MVLKTVSPCNARESLLVEIKRRRGGEAWQQKEMEGGRDARRKSEKRMGAAGGKTDAKKRKMK